MRKLLLLTLITFTNVSYASFPVSENVQTEVVETIESPNYANSPSIWGILSLSFALLSVFLLPNFSIMLIFSLLAVIFGIIGLTNKVNWTEIVGLILGVLMTIISGGIVGLIVLFGDT